MSNINRKFFFDTVRLSLFDGSLRQGQVNGMTAILDYWETHHATKDDRWLAYALGTTHHEVDRRAGCKTTIRIRHFRARSEKSWTIDRLDL